MANLGDVSILNINGNEMTIKDAAVREIVNEIIEAIGANNTNISERINDLHNRSFDYTLDITSNDDSEIANIQDGIYKLHYVTVTGSGDNEVKTLNNSAILIQNSTKQYRYKDGQLSSRTKTNDTWGDWITFEGGVTSVNGQTGAVTIDTGVTSFNGSTGAVTYTAPVTSVNGQTGAVTIDTGVTSFNGQTGAVTYTAPVTSVNGQTGVVTIDLTGKADKSAAIGSLRLSINSTDYKVTLSGTKVDGTTFTCEDVIDLPLETMVVSGAYDDTTQKIILTLKNGTTTDFPVSDLISGLQSEITSTNKLSADLISDGNTNKVVTQTEKDTWNNKVTSVNGQTGVVTIDTGVTSFNGQMGAVTYTAPVTSVNGQTGAVVTELSSEYVPSTAVNDELELAAGDTYEEAFGKIEKALNDHATITATALNTLAQNSQLNTIESISVNGVPVSIDSSKNIDLTIPDDNNKVIAEALIDLNDRLEVVEGISEGVTSFNGQTGAVTYTAPVTSVNGQTGVVTIDMGGTELITATTSGGTDGIYTIDNATYTAVVSAITNEKQPVVKISVTEGTFFVPMYRSANNAYRGSATSESYTVDVWLNNANKEAVVSTMGSSIEVDDELSETSTNPVQNNVITAQILENEEIVATALNNLNDRVELKQDQLVSGTTIKTINNQSILGSGNITISGGSGGGDVNVIETVKVNGTALTPDANKTVNVVVPVDLADLTDDATHRLVTDTEKSTWNGKQDRQKVILNITALNTSTHLPTFENYTLQEAAALILDPTIDAVICYDTDVIYNLVGIDDTWYYYITFIFDDDYGPAALGLQIVNGTIVYYNEYAPSFANIGFYTMPSGGIPKTDLASAVQTSLGKADTALQSYTETDPTVPAHVKSITQANINSWNNKLDSAPVTSVNGQTGAVTIDTGVTSFNGQTGTVTYTAPVTSVNGQTGAVNLTIPSAVTESTVSGWGFTKNAGTVTGVKMNGTTNNPTNGVVDLGTVLTSFTETDPTVPSHVKNITTTDISNWNNKLSTAPVTSVNGQTGAVNLTIPTVNDSTVTITMNGNTVGTFTLNKSGNTTIDLGTVLTSHQSIKTVNNESLTGTGNISINGLPTVTSADNGKVLMVVNGAWQLVTPVSLYSGSTAPSNSQGNNGDIYVQS